MTSSKLGIHVNNWSYEAEKHAECQPAVLKSIEHNRDKLDTFRATSPGTLTIGRVVLDGWDGRADFANPQLAAQAVAGIILAGLKGCRYHVVEGTNEPIINNEDQAKRICEFNIHLARRIQAEGFDFAAYSWGGTRPDIQYTRFLEPALKEARYLAMHAYGPGPLFHEPYWYLLNYRLFWRALGAETRNNLSGLLLTEFGIAKGLLHTQSDVGWLSEFGPKIEPRHYGSSLIAADRQLDCYVKGATIFQTGDLYGKWRTFEFKQLLPGIQRHIRSFVRPNGGKMKELPENQIHALDVSEWGGPIGEDQWEAAYDAGFRLAIVQAWGGGPVPGGKNEYCAQQLAGARKAGVITATYVWIPPDETTKTEFLIQAAKDAAGSEYQHIKFMAIDIEGKELLHPTDPKARLTDAISHVKDKPVVIYTSRYMWDRVMDMATGFENYPLWDARYDKLAELDTNWLPYGGWKERAMKQYQGTTTAAGGISADLNVAHVGRLFPSESEIQKRLTIINSATDVQKKAVQELRNLLERR